MRTKREWLLAPDHETNGGIYHCVSRVVWKEFIFGAEEKEFFRKMMRRFEKYCGVQVLSYCLMSNHFHILVKVPPRPRVVMKDEEFLKRLMLIYSKVKVREVEKEIELIRNSFEEQAGENLEYLVDELKERYTRRMWDLSEFMKALKQKFTLWYNKKNGKKGTLWEGRFKSVLVQGGFAAKMTAAYIDLNPVRAGIVEDAKDYRWSSYGEAVAGDRMARQGLVGVFELDEMDCGNEIRREAYHPTEWQRVMCEYRMLLAEEGEALDQDQPLQQGESIVTRQKRAKGYSKEEVQRILESGGKLHWMQLLRCKTRYFTDGVVIGSKTFVDEYFDDLKEKSGEFQKRNSGGRRIKSVTGKTLFSFRDLKKDVIQILDS